MWNLGPGSSRSTGQSLVEFALVFPIIVLIFFGLFDLGRGVFAYNTLENAARDGARVAAVNQVESSPGGDCNQSRPIENPLDAHWSIKTCAVVSATSLGISESDVTITYAPPPNTTVTCGTPLHVGCIATVTIVYEYAPATPLIGGLVGKVSMSASSDVPVERVFP